MSYYIGAKYFRADLGESALQSSAIRILSFDDFDKLYKAIDYKGETKKINEEELKKYTMLNPDGILMVSYVKNDGLNDVMLTFHRIKDHKASSTPSIICRQNAVDIFAALEGKNNRIGLCVSNQTCPTGVRFKDILDYDEMESAYLVYLYMEDTLDDILTVCNHKKADKVLRNLKMKYDQLVKDDKEGGDYKLYGVCETLEELLSTNDFMTEFHREFEVLEVPFSLKWEEKLPKKALLEVIAEHTHKVPNKFYVVPYNRTIDVSTLYKNWIFMTADPKKAAKDDRDIYIVGYDIDYQTTFAQLKYGSKENMVQKFQELGFS